MDTPVKKKIAVRRNNHLRITQQYMQERGIPVEKVGFQHLSYFHRKVYEFTYSQTLCKRQGYKTLRDIDAKLFDTAPYHWQWSPKLKLWRVKDHQRERWRQVDQDGNITWVEATAEEKRNEDRGDDFWYESDDDWYTEVDPLRSDVIGTKDLLGRRPGRNWEAYMARDKAEGFAPPAPATKAGMEGDAVREKLKAKLHAIPTPLNAQPASMAAGGLGHTPQWGSMTSFPSSMNAPSQSFNPFPGHQQQPVLQPALRQPTTDDAGVRPLLSGQLQPAFGSTSSRTADPRAVRPPIKEDDSDDGGIPVQPDEDSNRQTKVQQLLQLLKSQPQPQLQPHPPRAALPHEEEELIQQALRKARARKAQLQSQSQQQPPSVAQSFAAQSPAVQPPLAQPPVAASIAAWGQSTTRLPQEYTQDQQHQAQQQQQPGPPIEYTLIENFPQTRASATLGGKLKRGSTETTAYGPGSQERISPQEPLTSPRSRVHPLNDEDVWSLPPEAQLIEQAPGPASRLNLPGHYGQDRGQDTGLGGLVNNRGGQNTAVIEYDPRPRESKPSYKARIVRKPIQFQADHSSGTVAPTKENVRDLESSKLTLYDPHSQKVSAPDDQNRRQFLREGHHNQVCAYCYVHGDYCDGELRCGTCRAGNYDCRYAICWFREECHKLNCKGLHPQFTAMIAHAIKESQDWPNDLSEQTLVQQWEHSHTWNLDPGRYLPYFKFGVQQAYKHGFYAHWLPPPLSAEPAPSDCGILPRMRGKPKFDFGYDHIRFPNGVPWALACEDYDTYLEQVPHAEHAESAPEKDTALERWVIANSRRPPSL